MRRILNFGSMNLDTVYTVDHFGRPGETLPSLEMEVFPGGKGLNQSVALARAGAEVYHAGKIGKDGNFLLRLLQSAGVDTSFVEVINGHTGKAIIQVEESTGQNGILLYHGANWQMTELFLDEVLAGFPGDGILVMQNEINLGGYLLERAAGKGMQIALTPSPIDDSLLQWELGQVTWLLLNEVEGEALTGKTQPEEILDSLLGQYPDMRVVLTLGEKGAFYADREKRLRQPAFPAQAVDTTGAGDTFAGYFLAGIARGQDEAEAMEEAAQAAAIAVSRFGAAVSVPSRQEVLQSLQEEKSVRVQA